MNTLCFGGQFSDWISSHTNHKVAKVSENNRFCLLFFLHSEIIIVFYRHQDLSWTLGAKAQQKRKKHVKNSAILRRHFHEIKFVTSLLFLECGFFFIGCGDWLADHFLAEILGRRQVQHHRLVVPQVGQRSWVKHWSWDRSAQH